jgi:hypothetical protein
MFCRSKSVTGTWQWIFLSEVPLIQTLEGHRKVRTEGIYEFSK